MRFGLNEDEAKEDPRFQSSGSGFLRYPKDGDQTFRILQEPKDWVYFAEHFNPGGFSFPCTGEEACPGCTSDSEKMQKANKKVAFNVLEDEYVNVWKIPPTLSDKLKIRYERIGTIRDRDYTITRYKTGKDKVEYDVEGNLPSEINLDKYQLNDIEQLLVASFEESWGDSEKAKKSKQKAQEAEKYDKISEKQEKAEESRKSDDPPSEPSAAKSSTAQGETEVTEDELRGMSLLELAKFLDKEGINLPNGINSTDAAVDWLMENQG